MNLEGSDHINDFEFGNYIYELRCKSGLTQGEMAEKLEVSNKAVSKWENGKSKPTTNTLRKLAVLVQEQQLL